MNKNEWMRKEIAVWRSEGVIDAPLAEVLLKRYVATSARMSWAAVLAGSFGALLIGLGVIALLAVNWDYFGRGARAAIALAPVICCGFLAGGAVVKGWRSMGFWEPLGIFWCLATGAAACLVAQTYQIGGTVPGLILFVALLTLPIVWVTRTLVGMALWPVWAVAWEGATLSIQDVSWGTLLCAFGIIALSIPALVAFLRRDLSPVARVTGERLSGLVYAVSVPLLIVNATRLFPSFASLDFGVTIFWVCSLIMLGVGAFCRILSWPMVATLVASCAALVAPFACLLLYILAFVLSGVTIARGALKTHLGYTNIGAVLFLWLVLSKFFASRVDFTLKGIVLIISGLLLVALNVIMVKIRKGGVANAK